MSFERTKRIYEYINDTTQFLGEYMGDYIQSLISERWIEILVIIVLGIAWRWFIGKNFEKKIKEERQFLLKIIEGKDNFVNKRLDDNDQKWAALFEIIKGNQKK